MGHLAQCEHKRQRVHLGPEAPHIQRLGLVEAVRRRERANGPVGVVRLIQQAIAAGTLRGQGQGVWLYVKRQSSVTLNACLARARISIDKCLVDKIGNEQARTTDVPKLGSLGFRPVNISTRGACPRSEDQPETCVTQPLMLIWWQRRIACLKHCNSSSIEETETARSQFS